MTTSTVELLLKEISEQDSTPQVVMMKGHLVVRNTVRSRK